MPGALRAAQRINRMSAPAWWSQARMAEESQAEAAATLSALEDAMNAAEHDDSSDSECRAKPEPDLEPEPEVEPIEVPATELEPPPPPPQGMQDVHGEEVARIGRLPSVTEAGDGDGDGDGGAIIFAPLDSGTTGAGGNGGVGGASSSSLQRSESVASAPPAEDILDVDDDVDITPAVAPAFAPANVGGVSSPSLVTVAPGQPGGGATAQPDADSAPPPPPAPAPAPRGTPCTSSTASPPARPLGGAADGSGAAAGSGGAASSGLLSAQPRQQTQPQTFGVGPLPPSAPEPLLRKPWKMMAQLPAGNDDDELALMREVMGSPIPSSSSSSSSSSNSSSVGGVGPGDRDGADGSSSASAVIASAPPTPPLAAAAHPAIDHLQTEELSGTLGLPPSRAGALSLDICITCIIRAPCLYILKTNKRRGMRGMRMVCLSRAG
jgi:hypothetical protein